MAEVLWIDLQRLFAWICIIYHLKFKRITVTVCLNCMSENEYMFTDTHTEVYMKNMIN